MDTHVCIYNYIYKQVLYTHRVRFPTHTKCNCLRQNRAERQIGTTTDTTKLSFEMFSTRRLRLGCPTPLGHHRDRDHFSGSTPIGQLKYP